MFTNVKSLLASLGPGILMATAAIGGSHLVAATQAGALFGWQLLSLIIIVNLLKYPFFRFGVEYTVHHNQSLVMGYKQKSPILFGMFSLISIIAAVVNTAGVLLLTSALLQYTLPIHMELTTLSLLILCICLGILLLGRYQKLDQASKIIMALLTITTLLALCIALVNGPAHPEPINPVSPYTLAMLGFLVALMGWMPAPIEISAINSLWLKEKISQAQLNLKQARFDFNLGYGLTLLLALVFFVMGVLLQYGQPQKVELAGVAFSKQLIDMYALTIGEWSRWLIASIAFLCMFGTTITVLDGYARILDEATSAIFSKTSSKQLAVILLVQSGLGMLVILFFKANLKEMLTFAMTLSFLTTPFYAWLNFSLVKGTVFSKQSKIVKGLTYLGLTYLVGFALLFVYWQWFLK